MDCLRFVYYIDFPQYIPVDSFLYIRNFFEFFIFILGLAIFFNMLINTRSFFKWLFFIFKVNHHSISHNMLVFSFCLVVTPLLSVSGLIAWQTVQYCINFS